MKIFVTGGAGFIGSNIVDLLIEHNHEVYIIDNLSTGKRENLHPDAVFYHMDLDSIQVEEVFKRIKPDIVIHHAAQIDVQNSIKSPSLDAEINIISTIKTLDLCVKYRVKKIIYASSAAVYGTPQNSIVDEKHNISPVSFYGISKLTPEYYLNVYSSLYNLKYTILRYSNVYGIRQDPKGEGGVVSIFLNKLINQQPLVIYGDGEQTRDFVYVKDVAFANLAALSQGDNETFNISTNTSVTINQLFNMMAREFSGVETPLHERERAGDIRHSCLDNSKAKDGLGWHPLYSLEQGLNETIHFYTRGDKTCLLAQN